MKNFILTLAVAGATVVGLASTADAGGRSMGNDKGWRETVYSVRAARISPDLNTGAVVEGRNTLVRQPSVQGVEPYIAKQIEQDSRGNR